MGDIGRGPWSRGYLRRLVSSNPGTAYWMDMTFFHIDLLLNLYGQSLLLFFNQENLFRPLK